VRGFFYTVMPVKRTSDPIGIFDSGIGGLTVANAINKAMPNEKLIYFGDTAHLPYGDKSAESIKHYAEKITEFLLEKNCKIIVIACNTASSVANKNVLGIAKDKALVLNVIEPVVSFVAKNFTGMKVGVIGTKGTIKSRVYARQIKKANAKIEVTSLATPLLAPMVEEGYYNNYISQTIIDSYLSTKSLNNIQALILACTHYPLIKNEVLNFYKQKVKILDSAEIVAESITKRLGRYQNPSKSNRPKHEFYVSDFTESFEKSTKIFFENEIHLDEIRLWD